ncbi:DUF6691 family protein [Methylocystis bryophila]|uniref:YeeE/YedE family protein n=1 Tax=Methylocystis bryophila TaxID=655015 RepID=A0A1W6MVG0_9HYPH|nr:DUF6691 family protein [Methylocystis bryophila]ARN81506.1 hypothetical protein B1812_10965 [Methylocystis bryophila]BDV37525.1 membrane protein [Methylocystis bryophila]
MRAFVIFAAGFVFGMGLYLSGMTQPSKVQAFLDLAGRWDPSLAFVMAGALAVGFPAFSLVKGRRRTLLGDELRLPPVGKIDRALVSGSFIFGVGWGLAGVCPGPALFNVGLFDVASIIFVIAMAAGMALERFRKETPRREASGEGGPPSIVADA